MKISLTLVIILFCEEYCCGNYLENITLATENDSRAFCSENEVWGPIMEQWTLKGSNRREGRLIEIPLSRQAYLFQDVVNPEIITRGNNNHGKIVVSDPNKKPPSSMKPPVRQVSETDLYLLSAIEKLVFKVDFMEKRLRRVEEMLYYVMAGNRVDIEPCPENATRIGENCYIFASTAGREYDWKAASKHCKKLGSVLAEFESIEENQDVVNHIQNNVALRGKDFWVGGLNPGLLWIWSNSARPIIAPGSQNNKDNPSASIHNDGRCLKLAYNPGLRTYAYKGSDCSMRHSYICELPENSSSNEIQRIGRSRHILNF